MVELNYIAGPPRVDERLRVEAGRTVTLGDRLTVGPDALDVVIQVRILVS